MNNSRSSTHRHQIYKDSAGLSGICFPASLYNRALIVTSVSTHFLAIGLEMRLEVRSVKFRGEH
jgi:hypothetical protein